MLSLAATLLPAAETASVFSPGTGSPSIGSLGLYSWLSQVSGLQIVGLLSPHNRVSQFPFMYVYISCVGSVSSGNPQVGTPSVCETVTDQNPVGPSWGRPLLSSAAPP